MCGILGYISVHFLPAVRFIGALKLLEHRGPDNIDYKEFQVNGVQILLGHTRLSIIDLTDLANQPFVVKDCSITFNGEIYNYESLRSELQNDGVVFKTNSDTEVILQCYLKYGINETLKRLRGMFAFAIFDRGLQKVILARDRIGIKPLYYFLDREYFIFASEIKSIKAIKGSLTIDKSSVANFFYHGYVPEPDTIYKEVRALEPGTYLVYDLEQFKSTHNIYWSLTRRRELDDEHEVLDKLDELLNLSVKEHLISDVPISFAFSGGLDSSLLMAIAKQYDKDITAFTIKRHPADIDYIYSQKIAKYIGIDHRVIELRTLNKEVVSKLFEIYDQPIAYSSIFSTYLLFKELSKEFKVSISGDGGDELFGGYVWYKRFLNLKGIPSGLFYYMRNFMTIFKDLLKYKGISDILLYKKLVLDRFDKPEIEAFLNEEVHILPEDLYQRYIHSIDDIQDMMYIDFFTFLRMCLIRSDLSSMSHSVENRVPFLDHRLVELAFSIHPNLFYKNGTLKYILKRLAERYLPREYIYRQKSGFSAPILNTFGLENDREFMKFIYLRWKEYHYD